LERVMEVLTQEPLSTSELKERAGLRGHSDRVLHLLQAAERRGEVQCHGKNDRGEDRWSRVAEPKKHRGGRQHPRVEGEDEPPPRPARAHLIRLADTTARRRAIVVLGDVPKPYCGFADHCFLLTNDHVEVLKREGIPFEVVA